jgi:homoserine O-succinyltransferase/O-acetyltransferase
VPVRTVATNEDQITRARWTCAFVNNMPDGAFDATERQFLGLLESATGDDIIDVTLHTMDGVPRGAETSARISNEYRPVDDIFTLRPNLLIVTGSNPIEINIEDEPYWNELTRLLEWAVGNVRSMLLSCLSAHAALSVFDDSVRVRLPFKCAGVFAQLVDVNDPLGAGIEPQIVLPHSRTNTVPREALEAAGYRVIIGSEEVGWSVARKWVEECDVVLVQGHPEYDPSSLLREYRRDARRYVRGERDELPVLPLHCVALDDWNDLVRVHETITKQSRDPELLEAYPFDQVGERAPWPWHTAARRLYANWLSSVN